MSARGFGGHVTLRQVIRSDLATLFEHQRDPEGSRMAGFVPRDLPAFMHHWEHHVLGDPSVTKQTILVDGEVAGNIGSWNQEGLRLVGYWIGNAFWNRGVATAALLEFLTTHEPTRPLHAYVAIGNLASRRVLEKCGFVPVGPAQADEVLMCLATHS